MYSAGVSSNCGLSIVDFLQSAIANFSLLLIGLEHLVYIFLMNEFFGEIIEVRIEILWNLDLILNEFLLDVLLDQDRLIKQLFVNGLDLLPRLFHHYVGLFGLRLFL